MWQGSENDGPMRKEEVEIIEAHVLEDEVQTFLDILRRAEVRPEFRGDEDFVSSNS